MNGFKVMAEAFQTAAAEGKIEKEEAANKIKIYNFLSDCSEKDLCELFDSSAFNEITKSYMRLAVKELIEENVIDEEQGRAIRNRFSLLFDEKKAEEVI